MLRSAALFLEILRIQWHFLRVEFHFQNNHLGRLMSRPLASNSASGGHRGSGCTSSSCTLFSIWSVTAGRTGPPEGPENLSPLYSGGLWLAVTFRPPAAPRRITSYAITGVGASRSVSQTRTP